MTDARLVGSTVAIIGIGLLGGSLGLALAGRCARRIGVVEEGDAATARAAIDRGVVDGVETLEDAVGVADIVVLATPVRTIIKLLPAVAQLVRDDTLVTDLGSTKSQIVAVMEGAGGAGVFVGGHPMCGGTAHGIEHADASLFVGATWALCPARDDGDEDGGDAVARGAELAAAVGARPLQLSAEEHDRAAALTSHLPYVVAQALVHVVAERATQRPGADRLAASGWARATEAASGDVAMWRDVLTTNAAPIVDAIDVLRAELGELATTLREHPAGVEAWLLEGTRGLGR